MIEPRGVSRKQAAAYAGCESLSAFNDWVRRGIMPGPIPGTRKWDRKAIDAALDRLSGIQPKIKSQMSPYDAWKASQNASAAKGNQSVNQKARRRDVKDLLVCLERWPAYRCRARHA